MLRLVALPAQSKSTSDQLSSALKALADESADRLIVAKLDRLARNVRVALEIDEDYAQRHGWGIVFGDMDVDTSTAVGKMQLSMFASVARFERDRISERTREALAIKRAQGVHGGFSHGVLLLTRSIMSQLAPYTFSAITGAMKARRSTVRR